MNLRVFRRALLAPAVVLVLPTAAIGQTAPPPSCTGPEYRQFDFWIGDWDVTNRNGKPAGFNRIEKILGGCVLQENWKGARGSEGRSFNLFDATDRKWHQTWVDNSGSKLELSGGLEGSNMVLSSESAPDSAGKITINRITWTPKDATHVEQHWQVSTDGGATWTEAFWGLYAKRPGKAAK
jgi:hypothetical protein